MCVAWTSSLPAACRLNQSDGALLEVGHELGRNPRPRQVLLLQAAVESAHGFDILLPDGEQELDVLSLAHRLAKRAGKLTWFVEACFLGTRCRAQHPGANWRRSLLASRLAHANLLAVIKGKTEGIAEGGKRPLGGIGLGAFKRKLMACPGVGALPSPVPDPSRTMVMSPARTLTRTLAV